MVRSPKKLHIVMLIDHWFPHPVRSVGSYGGAQVHVNELKTNLETKYNCQVTLFYSAHPHLLLRFLWPLWAVIDVLLYSRYHQLDLIHAHSLGSALAAKMISLLLHLPVVYTVHGYPALDRGGHHPRAWLEKLVLTKMTYSAQITVSNDFLKFPNRNTNITVIPNGINLSRFNRIQAKKTPYPSLIWVGQDDPSKGLPILKAAIRKVRTRLPHFQARLITNGQLSGNALIRAYKQAHVFALASLTESQPITLLEAWAAKLPVVVTAVGDNTLMVKHGVNGYLVEPNNAQQLSSYLLKVLRGKVTSNRLGQAGYRTVTEHYSWKQVAKATARVYGGVLNASSAAVSLLPKTASSNRYSPAA